MRTAIILAAISITISGCATSPVPVQQAKEVPADRIEKVIPRTTAPHGTVTVVRDSGYLGGGCYFGFYVDGELVARLDTSERHTITLPVGEHIFGTASVGRALCSREDDRREISAILKPGDDRVYRISLRSNGEISIEPSTMLRLK